MFSVGLMEFGNFMLLNAANPAHFLFWGKVSLTGCCFIPANWSLFSLIFGRNNEEEQKEWKRKWKIFILCIYIISFIFFLFVPTNLFIFLPSQSIRSSGFYPLDSLFLLGKIGRFFPFFLLMTFVFILCNLETIYRNSKGIKSWQIKYSIMGIFAPFLFYIYLASRAILFPFIKLNTLPFSSIIILISTGLLCFSIVRHRLMDIDLNLSRHVFYGSFTITLVSGYLFFIGLAGELVRVFKINFNQLFYPVIILFILMVFSTFLLLDKNRKKIKNFFDRHVYRNKYDYRFEWTELTKRVSTVLNLDEMLDKFMEYISETMCVKEVYIWLYLEDDAQYVFVASTPEMNKQKIVFDKKSLLIEFIRLKKVPFSLSPSFVNKQENNFLLKSKEFFDLYKINTLSPLMINQELIGFIALGKEITGATYNYEDYDILKTICHQAASAIMNIKLSERLHLAKEIDLMNKISSFVLHDLKNSISMLSLIIQNASHNIQKPEFQKDLMETISKTITNMNKLMGKMASMPKEIILEKTETDIVQMLGEIIQDMRLGNNGIRLEENYENLPRVKVDQQRIRSVFHNIIMNAQESLLNNGNGNGNGQKIAIATFVENSSLVIEISDNGMGMSKDFLDKKLFKPFQTTKKKGLGIGLYQCKMIIVAHGGRIEVKSKQGEGSTFRVYLCIDDDFLHTIKKKMF